MALASAILIGAAPLRAGAQSQPTGAVDLVTMVQRAAPAVVNIAVVTRLEKPRSPLARDPVLGPLIPDGMYRFDTGKSSGSGVVVDAKEGLIVTNHHVVARATSIKVVLRDRRELDAKLVGSDPPTDIAVLRIPAEDLVAMPVGDSDASRIGETVVAIGNPFGLGQTVTSGIISAVGRSVGMDGYEEFLQTDAAINPGNSGGALTNMRGELIGVNTQILSPGGRGNIGIGFAVPSNTMKSVVEQLVRHGEVRRGRVGMSGEDVTPVLARARALDVKEGAVVTRVDPASPAQRAGLRPGDVIVAIDGRAVASHAALRNRLALVPVGSSAELRYLRAGKAESTRVEVAPITPPATQGADAQLGLFPGARLANHPSGGVTVVSVEPGSASHAIGIRAGDIIDSLNREPVPGIEQLQDSLQKLPGGVLGVVRGESKVQLRYRGSF